MEVLTQLTVKVHLVFLRCLRVFLLCSELIFLSLQCHFLPSFSTGRLFSMFFFLSSSKSYFPMFVYEGVGYITQITNVCASLKCILNVKGVKSLNQIVPPKWCLCLSFRFFPVALFLLVDVLFLCCYLFVYTFFVSFTIFNTLKKQTLCS